MRIFLPLLLAACQPKGDGDDTAPAAAPPLSDAELDALSIARIKADVDLLADDSFGGRVPESAGHALARALLIDELTAIGLEPAGEDGGYTLPFDDGKVVDRFALDEDGEVVAIAASHGVDIAALLPGQDPAAADETLVLMAHYDHLGVTADGQVYNGAYDDLTGVAALLELARFLAAREGGLRRSVLFLITDMEEGGLNGARHWVNNPTVPLDDVVVALSVDPIGRGLLPDYAPLVLLGLERSPTLQDRIRELRAFSDEDVAFINRAPIPVFASDQDTFYEVEDPVPAFWFVSPGMSFYHTTDDDPETIDYGTVRAHLRFLAQIVADVGDSDARFTDEGKKDLSTDDAAEAAALLRGVLGSAALSDEERATAQDLIDTFDEAVASGEAGSSLSGTYLSAAVFLLLELTEAHPGPVPPPWPD